MSIKRGQEHKNINPKQWCSQGAGGGAIALEAIAIGAIAGGGAIAIGAIAGGGAIGLSTKMQNKKNITFLALLRLFFALK